MGSTIIFFTLLILVALAFYYLVLIFKDKTLSLSKKLIWSVFVLFIPIIGGIVYSIKGGEKLNV